ncbi:helicase-related protein [Nostoc punctiforme UO1]|uniref:helicase-related protein n=1 Tax=Nostoc punctiforme TaxID=272131 RepID=UPI0030A4A4B7
MTEHIANRDKIIQSLREELVGPSPQGELINCSGEITFNFAKEGFYNPWRQDNGEEILQRDPPRIRYGVGVLYPLGTKLEDDNLTLSQLDKNFIQDNQPEEIEIITDEVKEDLEKIKEKVSEIAEDNADDFDLSAANASKPSSIGISFLAEFSEDSVLVIQTFDSGRYRPKKVKVEGNERTWWLRSPVNFTAEFSAVKLCSMEEKKHIKIEKIDGLQLNIEVFSRPDQKKREGIRLLTVCLINRTNGSRDEDCLFQAGFKATIVSPKGEAHILPYPKPDFNSDDEEQSIALLYRQMETYAVGHGCAADWDKESSAGRVKAVTAECLPTFETPSITPDIGIEVPMAPLAGLVQDDDGFASLSDVVSRYEQWINYKKIEIRSLDAEYQNAANRHMEECTRVSERMKNGLDYLQSNAQAKRAFQLANYAMLLQQICSSRDLRQANFDAVAKRYTFSPAYQAPNHLQTGSNRGKWRAFQVAFLLMSIQSTAQGEIPERKTVELIWFPTGGGKTEAYLGLSAFSLFMRRLKNPEDVGVNVLMRYTLRLLTAQQFQRASALICSMEYLRRPIETQLGKEPFSIGIWVGGETTPNNRKDAVSKLNQLQSNPSAENPFIISRCPWCSAQMGRYHLNLSRNTSKDLNILGYQQSRGTVILKCSDNACEFHTTGLPVYVIDEDIYEKRPSLIIGTVDKFALLAWSYAQKARALFGIGSDGVRENSPPGLIIQDELHLISGPLGSVVGLYETVIEELCTDRRNGQEIQPKIVCSTATIRRYADQVKALYGREDVVLFPPPGIDAEDSFFSRYARNNHDRTLERGRVYVGVHAPVLKSLQTAQMRTFAAILQAPVFLNPEEKDPWWTLLLFFSSLKELGTTLSLLQSDIPGYLRVIKNRLGLDKDKTRRLWHILELTGRIRSDKVPESINKLEVRCDNTNNQLPIDVCLASNIIEVGVDIDRLSLMTVVGQPKTTSQYIQVTGRVGRRWWERPGLVVTLYSPTRPRDRSHFEKFRSYHQQLYAQVEPTSITPFSPPVLDRALHAIMATYVRQTGDQQTVQTPYPYPKNLIEQLREILIPRIQLIDKAEVENFEKVFEERASQWQRWQRTNWEKKGRDTTDIPLLRAAGDYASPEWQRLSWSTPMSMRNVDAECQAEITNLYLYEGAEENA